MIIVLKENASEKQIEELISEQQQQGIIVREIHGAKTRVVGLAGDTSRVDESRLLSHSFVENIIRVQEPYKLASRKFHPEDTVVAVGNAKFGGGNFSVIAGPCAVESEEQIITVAKAVKASGATCLRGGAFKPRTSPYAFQGMGLSGLELLKKAREATGLPIVTEIVSVEHLAAFEKDVDIIQVGARNMQNFALLRAVGALKKPVLLKRGLSATIDELLVSAEYVLSGGATDVILCERGIRTFETATRNTLDLSAIPVLRKKTHLPIIVDPSHATGFRDYVAPLALAATVCGADGLIIEVHNNPEKALCDGAQSVTPAQFDEIMQKVGTIRGIL